nr:immunoglobulin light chain junction region [Macaca mulatta]
RMQALEFPYSF